MAEQTDTQGAAPRSCPHCGARAQEGQRRCTNCGTSVEQRRLLPRRTPMIAALAVTLLGGGAVVVAQAAVTDQASRESSAPVDTASAPIPVSGTPLPPADRATSTKPKAAKLPESTTPGLSIPKTADDLLKAANDARNKKLDGENLPEDTTPKGTDLTDPKKLKIKKAKNYDPALRAGVEFGKPKAAIDKRTRTVWDVNVPADGQPMGVGLVVDLGDVRKASSIKIQTPTPGFGAVIYRTDAPDLPETLEDNEWTEVAKVRSVTDGVEVLLGDEAKWTRYVLVYLTTTRSTTDTRVAISNLEVLP